jgi:replicative DNA helicase
MTERNEIPVDSVHEHHERVYAGTVVSEPRTLDEHPLAEGDLLHPVYAAIVDAVRIARRDRPRVTVPAIKRALEVTHARHAARAFEVLDGGTLVYEPDIAPIVESLRERGACRRAKRAAEAILGAARSGKWAEVQAAIADASSVRADGVARNPIVSFADAMELAAAPKAATTSESDAGAQIVIPFERRLNGIIRLTPKTRIVLGAPTNVGKTSLVARWCRTAMMSGVPSAMISVEDPVEHFGVKWLAEHASIDSERLRDRELGAQERESAARAIDEARGSRMWVVHVEDRSLDGVLSAVRSVAALGAKLVAIDYLQAIRGDRALKSAKERIDHNLNELIAVGNVAGVAMIIVSQLSRQEKGSGTRPPTLSDLKESGDIENAATWVVLLHREKESSEAPIIGRVAKVKNGRGIGTRVAWCRDRHGVLEECDPPAKRTASSGGWSGGDDDGGMF